jgi:hypothetical protein
MAQNEQNLRLGMLNGLLTTPHRKLDALHPMHAEMVQSDPRFYVRLAAWYADVGEIRDHKESFIVNLTLSDFPGHREVGLALLRDLPPYEVIRVIDFINGRKKPRKVRVREDQPKAEAPKPGLVRRVFNRVRGKKAAEAAPVAVAEAKFETVINSSGLFRNPPRSLKTEVERYLREREADVNWFDSTALVARKALKRLYALLHIKPGERAQKILFDEEPPQDSRLFALRELSKATTPAEQARAIIENRIPYRVASTVVKQMTPTVLLALIEAMTPQELINNLASLRKRGALENSDLKAMIELKLEEAKKDSRVSAFKAQVASKAVDASEKLSETLNEITDSRVKAKGKITRATALLLDKSGSMDVALAVGTQLGAMISAVTEADLFAYAFDGIAYPVETKGKSVAEWEKALHGIKAGGSTSCGVAIEWMARQKQRVEQFVFVTDEGENATPFFKQAYETYATQMGIRPSVTIVKVGQASTHLEGICRELGVALNVFEFRGDYYSLPNVIPLLSMPSQADLLMEILNYPLPVRRVA